MISCQKNERVLNDVPQEDEVAAVTGRKCASQEILEEQMRNDPQRARNLEELEKKTQAFQGRSQFRTTGKLTIPVVVNVALSNASRVDAAQINSQIAVLNRDYAKANSELKAGIYLAGYSLDEVANCDLEFVLSNVVYKNVSGSFGTNDAVKKSTTGISPTDPTTKLNIWVCDLSSGLLGYAQFPGGPSSTDGVVIDYQAFGTTSKGFSLYPQFNSGRTATHEVGHWLNLRHIWGDRRCGSDLVDDTPLHDDANGGCPAKNLTSKCSGKPLEQWMNYMDYTDDRCMYMFTAGQKLRMDAAIDLSRKAYVTASK